MPQQTPQQQYIPKRPVYRKCIGDGDVQYYVCIHPDGNMLELSLNKDLYGTKVQIYQTSKFNPFNADLFRKYKEVCLVNEWKEALRKAQAILRGSDPCSMKYMKTKLRGIRA